MAMLWFFVLLILLVIAIATLPTWPYARERRWGYGPSGAAFGLILLLLLLFWFGVIGVWWPWAAAY